MSIKKKPTLSLVINAKNEERNIQECIKSAKDIVDEIIVVDMQSSDKTIELARKMGAKIFSVPDYNFADPARNFAIEQATSKWVLVLDADERLTKVLAGKLVKIINEDKFDVIEIPYKNIHFGKWIKHTAWWPDYQYRLFKKGYIHCSGEIHTRYSVKGRLLTLPPKEENAIIHFQTKKTSDLISKIDRYTSLEDHFNKNKEISLKDVMDYSDREFYWRFFEQKGYLDGTRGFVLSRFMEFYRFLVFVKYWEKNEYPELGSPTQLKATIEQRNQHSSFNSELEKDLFDKIINSKFYKLWRLYCEKRDFLLETIKSFRSINI